MAKAEKVYEFEGSQNLNTTPIDITGLQGDTYDYELMIWCDVNANNAIFTIQFNNDATSNYRDYYMQGDGSSATASTSDTASALNLGLGSFDYPSLGIFTITGDSSGERKLSGNSTHSISSSDTKIKIQDYYWKNTADELTSIQIARNNSSIVNCHIILYRVPKTTSQENWEKVGVLNWASESTEKSFTGLDGDNDRKYRLVYDLDGITLTEINNDNGSNYVRQQMTNSSGSLASANTTATSMSSLRQGEFIINAESGAYRLIQYSGSDTIDSTDQLKRAFWWQNTADNITSIDCAPAASATGTATLYRQKYGADTDGSLPWELIDKYDISGDFSAGQTTTLSGDDWKLLRVQFVGTGGADLRARWNSDTGTNYETQYIFSGGSSTSAFNAVDAFHVFAGGQDIGESRSSDIIIYPKSGTYRPLFITSRYDEDTIIFRADWWLNTADEITSMLAYASDTDTVTGTIKVWGLR